MSTNGTVIWESYSNIWWTILLRPLGAGYLFQLCIRDFYVSMVQWHSLKWFMLPQQICISQPTNMIGLWPIIIEIQKDPWGNTILVCSNFYIICLIYTQLIDNVIVHMMFFSLNNECGKCGTKLRASWHLWWYFQPIGYAAPKIWQNN
jgi:hypothetical protein